MEFGTVREIAERIVKINSPYYTKDLLGLVPEELLNKKLTDENFDEIIRQVDAIRLVKTNELRSKIKTIKADKEVIETILEVILNYSNLSTLPEDFDKRGKEIKFLFNVAATIGHQ